MKIMLNTWKRYIGHYQLSNLRRKHKRQKFAHLSPHCVLHIYNSIVLSAIVVAKNLFHLNWTWARVTKRVWKLKLLFSKASKIEQPTFFGIDDKVQILHLLLRRKIFVKFAFSTLQSCQKHWSDDDVALMIVREVQETSWGFGAHAKISAGAHHYRDHASLLFSPSFQ